MVKFITALLATIIVFGVVDKASASNGLTKEQKETYYEEYVNITKEAKEKYPDAGLGIVPFDEFKEDEWVKPEEFKKIVEDMAVSEFEPVEDTNKGLIQPLSTTTASKKVAKKINGLSLTITVKGSFNTQLVNGIQVFGSINSLTSSSDKGTWKQTGYTPYLIDGLRTYEIDVTGTFIYNGSTTTGNHITTEFHCSSTGVVS